MSEFIIVFREVLEASLVVGIIYLILENTLDSEDLISRAPSEGARSQKPRIMKVGFSYDF